MNYTRFQFDVNDYEFMNHAELTRTIIISYNNQSVEYKLLNHRAINQYFTV